MRRRPKASIKRRLLRIATFAISAMALMSIASASAQAASSYRQIESFGSSAFPSGVEYLPGQIAVDDATGDVLVVDRPENRVLVFDDGGAASTVIAEFGGGELAQPYGIAIDQSNGDVYVSDEGNSRIVRYVRDGAPTPTYTRDLTYSSPPAGTGSGQIGNFGSPLAIDPSNGDLLVGDRGNELVSRFTSAGTFVSSFDGTGSPGGRFVNLLGLSVAPAGEIYLIDLKGKIGNSEDGEFGHLTGVSRVERFKSDGTPNGAIKTPASASAVAIAYDADQGDVLFASQYGTFSSQPPTLTALHEETVLAELPMEEVGSGGPSVTGLAVRGGAGGPIYAMAGTSSNYGFGEITSVQVFEHVVLPDATLGAATQITPVSATLNGVVDPLGTATKYFFEYSADGGGTWAATPEADAGSGSGPVAVSAQIEGLLPNQEYLVKLDAFRATGSASPCKSKTFCNTTRPTTFKTLPTAPSAVTGGVEEVTKESAYLKGSVNPHGAQTTYRFEYGLTTAYGTSVPTGGVVIGAGRQDAAASFKITGLQPGATYHYRVVAESAGGPSFGEDHTFVTANFAARGYELVSPVNSANVAVGIPDDTMPLVRADGSSIVFGTQKAGYPDAESVPYFPRVFAARGASGWSTKTIDAPEVSGDAGAQLIFGTVAVSADQTRALVISKEQFESEGSLYQSTLYIKNLLTGDLTPIASGGIGLWSVNGAFEFLGASPDLSAVAFVAKGNLTPVTSSAEYKAYEWREGEGLSLISLDPNGAPFTNSAENAGNSSIEKNRVSSDGRTVYFEIGSGPQQGLYMHRAGQSTTLVSVSHRAGDPKTPVPASLVGASPDGRYAVFRVLTNQPLTENAPGSIGGAASENAYLYDSADDSLTFLASQVSERARALWNNPGEMIFQETNHSGGTTIYEHAVIYLHSGEESQIYPERTVFSYDSLSANERYYVFETTADNEFSGPSEIYRYDTISEQTECVSCRKDGLPPTGNATIGRESGEVLFQHHASQAVSDNGTVLFDTSESLLPADANGTRDVYAANGEQIELISGGNSDAVARFGGISPSGADAFFTTNQQLVPEDQNTSVDMYDARIGAVTPKAPVEAGQCSGTDCRSPSANPAAPGIASEASQSAATKAKACSKGKKRVQRGGKQKCGKANRHKPHKRKSGGGSKRSRTHKAKEGAR